jgi:hypothetical protein
MIRTVLLTAGAVFAASAALQTRGDQTPGEKPVIPEKLKVPAGNRLLLCVEAEGVQVYVSKEGKGGKVEWAFKSPLADLVDGKKRVGYHFAGPRWEMMDGSKVVRDESENVESVLAPKPAEDIPWLRIKVRPEGEQGKLLRRVTYVLRLNTRGGLPPTTLPVRAGTEVGVKYQATYCFYGPAK